MATSKTGVPVVIPSDVWQQLAEVRAQLDAICPGAPPPIEESLRALFNHYRHCTKAEEDMESFCERAKAWKNPK